MSTEITVSELVAAFVRACQPEMVVEIGAHYGLTSERIGKAIRANGHGRFVAIELDQGFFESCTIRCQDVPEVEIVKANSREYIPPAPVDFLFVDGADDRVVDVEHFAPYLTNRALVLIHDMGSSWYFDQIPRMVELLGERHIMIDNPRGLLIFKVDR